MKSYVELNGVRIDLFQIDTAYYLPVMERLIIVAKEGEICLKMGPERGNRMAQLLSDTVRMEALDRLFGEDVDRGPYYS